MTTIEKKEFIKDLRNIKRNCLKDPYYNPENDIAYLVTKYNLSWRIIWRKIQEILSL